MNTRDHTPGAGTGLDVATAYNAVTRDIAAGYVDPADFTEAFAHYRAVQLRDRKTRQ
jgi:hypothetical protein